MCFISAISPIKKERYTYLYSDLFIDDVLLFTIFIRHFLHHFFNKLHHFTITYDSFQYNTISRFPCKFNVFKAFRHLSVIAYLKDVKLQIIGLFCRPQNRVIRCLGAVLDLTQAFVDISCRLMDGLCEQFIGHKV